jgi:GcrA cell cycle regulator
VASYAARQAWEKAANAGMYQARPKPEPEPIAPRRQPPRLLPPRVDVNGPPKPPPTTARELEGFDAFELAPDFSQNVRPDQIHRLQCKWPIGHPSSDQFVHCGARRLTGLPYCAPHCEVAYPPGSETRKKARAHAQED